MYFCLSKADFFNFNFFTTVLKAFFLLEVKIISLAFIIHRVYS